MTRSGILCGGAWCVDRNISINHWPPEETVATMLSERRHGGCPGFNMSTALKRLGAEFPVSAIGLIGDDADGKLITDAIDDIGIERHALKIRPETSTSFTLVMNAADTGRRTFFYSPGAHAVQTPDDFDFSNSTARIVHLGMPGIHKVLDAPWQSEVSGWVTVLKKAKAAGLKPNIELVSIEPEKIRAITLPLLAHLDTLIINDYEAGAITEIQTVRDGIADAKACRRAAENLMEHSNLALVAIHFPMGGIVMSRDGDVATHPSVNVPKSAVVGSNGAGDSFAAGILYGHHEGWPILKALKLAHAAAAASLRHESTTSAVIPWQECINLADNWGWRE
ncbi:MAG: carbohydrate kinase family protein [Alphaproteobacteria bacterium]|nr:carbohydrate kinase family protein [Alphaproteobacteria bacterium]